MHADQYSACSIQTRAIPWYSMQSPQQVNVGDLLKQIRQACGIQPPQIVIGGPQTILADDGDNMR